jgi:hypothetical protein
MTTIAFHDGNGQITGTQSGLSARNLDEYRARGLVFAEVPPGTRIEDCAIFEGKMISRIYSSARLSKSEIAADGVDVAVIDRLPDPCTLEIDGVRLEITGGRLELTADMPATYHVLLDQLPFRQWRAEIVAK